MGILELLFPATCVECKTNPGYLCSSCLTKVACAKATCAMCAKPAIDGLTHAKCTRPYSLNGVQAIWRYEGVVRSALLAMKYRYASDIAKQLAKLTVHELRSGRQVFPQKAVLVPIPLHKSRYNWRGFNQVEELGKPIAGLMGWGYAPALTRKKATIPQARLSKTARSQNLRGAFQVVSSNLDKSVPVVLFDDVYTTGSTMREAGKVLKRFGVVTVWGLAIAR